MSKDGLSAGPALGEAAPDYSGPCAGGAEIAHANYAGKWVVLYFYPRDDTSGCTREALEFTALLADFASLGVAVIGVSKDSMKKHEKFRDKHDLDVTLLSDAQGDVCERYGVWVEKSMYGKTHMGVERATYLIDGEGTVRAVWRKVKAAGHAQAVLEKSRDLLNG